MTSLAVVVEWFLFFGIIGCTSKDVQRPSNQNQNQNQTLSCYFWIFPRALSRPSFAGHHTPALLVHTPLLARRSWVYFSPPSVHPMIVGINVFYSLISPPPPSNTIAVLTSLFILEFSVGQNIFQTKFFFAA